MELSIKAAKGESIEETDDIDKEIELWKKQLGNNVEVLYKTDDIIAEMFIKFLNALLHDYETKMRDNFYDLFAKWEVRGFVNGSNSNHEGIDYIISRVNKMIKKIKNQQEIDKYKEAFGVNVNNNSFTKIILAIDMLGFKKDGINAFDIRTALEVEFQDYKYVIKFDNKLITEKAYTELVHAEERADIIRGAVKDTFQKIKLSFKNPPLGEL